MIATRTRYEAATLRKIFQYLEQASAFDSYDWPNTSEIRQTIQGWFGNDDLDRATLEWVDERLRKDHPTEPVPDLQRAMTLCRQILTIFKAEETLREMAAHADPFRQIGAEGAAQRLEDLKGKSLDEATLDRLIIMIRGGTQWMLAACIQHVSTELDKI